jgi:hypothetical protein
MALSPEDIVEAIVEELAMGDLGESVEAFRFERLAPGKLRLDFGDAGRFHLVVVEIDDETARGHR